MQETQEMEVQFLGQEDPLEEEMATHSNILAWKIPWTERGAWWAAVTWGRKELDMTEHITFPNTFLTPYQLCHSPSYLLGK